MSFFHVYIIRPGQGYLSARLLKIECITIITCGYHDINNHYAFYNYEYVLFSKQWCGNRQSYRTSCDKSGECLVK